ncbi:MAG: RtcB family protein [Myxococcota bacterium]|jgi:tRNA-splicing ligase RtcB|nr:RtcB family protein [Myxococcota bacterium]
MGGRKSKVSLERIDAQRWRIPKHGRMLADGVLFANQALIDELRGDPCVEQLANVAQLPGLVGPAMAMPDIHWGYGFPIGGVAAFDLDEGVISPGGVGYDINCGVRLLASNLDRSAVDDEGTLERLLDALYRRIPSGVGSSRDDLRLKKRTMAAVLESGAAWAVEQGYGESKDLERIEAGGCIAQADPEAVSERAVQRGLEQVGTLGSGNHFCELAVVEEVYDPIVAAGFGLALQRLTVMIHTGSRGLGYQVCDDSIVRLMRATSKYRIEVPDRQLCCAPLSSAEGRQYLGAMSAAANFAFANRQLLTHCVREAFAEIWGTTPIEVVYDVCHNIAKIEEHVVAGEARKLCVHRKGATRAFPAHHPELPASLRELGQPVLVPGDMGRYSFVLAAQPGALELSFGSSCHGAGRLLSRSAALKASRGRRIIDELARLGVKVRAASRKTLDEELPEAYKDVAQVVDVVEKAGIASKVAKLRPLGVIKG